MNAPIDTLAFAERFEGAGFGHEQARALANAFAETQDSIKAGLVTKGDVDLAFSTFEGKLNKQLGEMELRLTRQIAESSKDVMGRLWSAVTIIGGVSTAVAAAISAGIALLHKSGAF